MEEINKFKHIKGKKDSLYSYVLFNCSYAKIRDHITKQINNLDRMKDLYKKQLYISRYSLLKDHIECNDEKTVFNTIIFLGDKLCTIPLEEKSKNILKLYDHRCITYTCNDNYNIDYLLDLLYNDNHINVIKLNNNKIEYIRMTLSKKKVFNHKESKTLDIDKFINDNILSNEKFIIYGISSKLKKYKNERAYTVINNHLKDSDINDIINRIEQEDILTNLNNDLGLLQDVRHAHKIVFKKEILNAIRSGKLNKLYIDSLLIEKFNSNLAKMKIDINFDIIKIDRNIKSFKENNENIIATYDGVIGVNYY